MRGTVQWDVRVKLVKLAVTKGNRCCGSIIHLERNKGNVLDIQAQDWRYSLWNCVMPWHFFVCDGRDSFKGSPPGDGNIWDLYEEREDFRPVVPLPLCVRLRWQPLLFSTSTDTVLLETLRHHLLYLLPLCEVRFSLSFLFYLRFFLSY